MEREILADLVFDVGIIARDVDGDDFKGRLRVETALQQNSGNLVRVREHFFVCLGRADRSDDALPDAATYKSKLYHIYEHVRDDLNRKAEEFEPLPDLVMNAYLLTGEAKYADQIEKTLYNHLVAAQQPRGDDWCCYTPLEGVKLYEDGIICCHQALGQFNILRIGKGRVACEYCLTRPIYQPWRQLADHLEWRSFKMANLQQLPDHHSFKNGTNAAGSDDEGIRSQH